MNVYKNWLKKFVTAYAHQKLNLIDSQLSEAGVLKSNSRIRASGHLNVSTHLPHSLLHHMLILLIAFSAIALLYQLKIPLSFAFAISLLIILRAIFDVLKTIKNRQKMHSLQCIGHNWTLRFLDGSCEKIDIQSIYQGLGMLYMLTFVSKEGTTRINICIWKYQTKQEFLSYCSQLLLIGKNIR